MEIVELTRLRWSKIASYVAAYETPGGWAAQVGHGTGNADVRVLRIEPGGSIGAHATGSGQLLIPVEGAGWVQEGDGPHVPVAIGQAAYFPQGVLHAKGSDVGMIAVMVQVDDLALGGEL